MIEIPNTTKVSLTNVINDKKKTFTMDSTSFTIFELTLRSFFVNGMCNLEINIF